jgi:tetratricopeptide (TPR) repeat protein
VSVGSLMLVIYERGIAGRPPVAKSASTTVTEPGGALALRARKSIRIAKGINLNLSKSGVGISAGPRGLRYSVHSSGRRTASAGLPGTGVGYQKSWTAGSGRSPSGHAGTLAPAPKPGLFAPAYEKAFHKAVQTYAGGDLHGAIALFRSSSEKDSADRAVSDDLLAGLLSVQAGDEAAAIPFLEKVVGSDRELPDGLMTKYVAEAFISVVVTDNVSVAVPFGSLAAALVLAQCYRRGGRSEEAIGLLQQLHAVDADAVITLHLCSMLLAAHSYDEVVELAAGTTNTNDVTAELCVLLARALAAKGLNEAALAACKEALRSTKRDSGTLTDARYVRAITYERLGKRAQARKDLELIYASDPGYRDVRQRLEDTSY